jgi:hypothetical protein
VVFTFTGPLLSKLTQAGPDGDRHRPAGRRPTLNRRPLVCRGPGWDKKLQNNPMHTKQHLGIAALLPAEGRVLDFFLPLD